MRYNLIALIVAATTASPAAARPVYFVVAESPGMEVHHDSYVLPLSDPLDIAHARKLIAEGPNAGGAIVVAGIEAGADGINRDHRAPGAPEWSWHVTQFLGFADATPEVLDGWPGLLQHDVPAWITNTGGRIGFWGYTVVAELPTLTLAVTLNRDTASPGDLVAVSLSVANTGGTVAADIYFLVVLPAASASSFGCPVDLAVVFVANGGSDFPVLCASAPPQTFPAYVSNVAIPEDINAAVPNVLSLTWPAGAPGGPYTFVILATPPGALADGTLDQGDILAIDLAELTVSR